jgi:hypothetical protein
MRITGVIMEMIFNMLVITDANVIEYFYAGAFFLSLKAI